MRWWNWLLSIAPPPLLAAIVYLADDLPRSRIGDFAWPVVIVGLFLIGQAGLVFIRPGKRWQAPIGIIYSAICPFTMAFAGLLGACAAGNCI